MLYRVIRFSERLSRVARKDCEDNFSVYRENTIVFLRFGRLYILHLAVIPLYNNASILEHGEHVPCRRSREYGKEIHLVPKVRGLCHVTEQTHFNDASEHLDLRHDLNRVEDCEI